MRKMPLSRGLDHLGCYNQEEDVVRAYDWAAKRFFGEFARLNFPGKSLLQLLTMASNS